MRFVDLLIVATLVTGCGVNVMEEPKETLPEDDFVRLSLIACGEPASILPFTSLEDQTGQGNISFAWERVTADSDDVNKLSLIISDGDKAVPSYTSNSAYDPCPYTGLYVEPFDEEPACAGFQTARFYSQSDLINAVRCYAVSGSDSISEGDSGYSFDFEMPAIFKQTKDHDPSFLKDCVCMYAAAPFQGNQTSLSFNHIPAYFRFLIDNQSPSSLVLQDVSIFLSDQTGSENHAVASSKASVTFDLNANNTELSYDSDGYDEVVTVLDGSDRTLSVGDRYIAYSMALSIGDDDAFRNKMLNFQVRTMDSQTVTYQLSGDDFAEKNDGVSDWIGGKSYTVQISIGNDAVATGKMTSSNTIEVFSDNSGPYTLKYVDADGTPLEEYADICSLTVDGRSTYDDFIDANIAPVHASAIGIFDSQKNCQSTISISSFKQEFSTPLYSFGILSDIHLTSDNASKCQDKFQAALTYFNEKDVDFTCVCGDISEKGTAEEYAIYKQMAASYSPDTPVYTTTGNHDARSRGINHDDWKEYTGSEVVFDFSKTLPDGRKDHFIFFGMSYWSQTGAYVEEHVKWLEQKLAEYHNERCFIITHMFFPDMAGNMNQVYPETNWLAGTLLERLKALCNNNPNTIWFSGHSHWKWSLQKFDDKANVCRTYDGNQPASGWCVHIPACAKPVDSDGQSRESRTKESEGAIIKVYEDHIDIYGLDFINRKYLPIAIYRLDTSE